MNPPSVHVVIVNWNSGVQLSECLHSFETAANDRVMLTRVTVVDNASGDGSCDNLPASSLPLRLIRNTDNRGFAAACNQGAARSDAEFLLFLNPDTRLMPGALERPASYLQSPSNGNVGIVGIQLVDATGHVARNCARRPTPCSMIGNSIGLDRMMPSLFPPHFLAEWAHDETRVVDQVMGAFMLVRRSLFEALGGFDERFFVYFEDLDFAERTRLHGFATVYLATAQAYHRGQGTTASAIDRRTHQYWRSRILFALKHFSLASAIMITMVTLLVEPLARIAAALASRKLQTISQVLRAAISLCADLPAILWQHARRHGSP